MLIDTHAHLDMKDFQKDRDLVLERAVKGSIVHIISIGIDLNSSTDALELARKCEYISASVGVHPHNADDCTESNLDKLATMASAPEIVAWGEIGLDFFRGYSTPEAQSKIFKRQLAIAKDLKLPVIIHDRDAHEDVYSILKKMGKGEGKGVIHCFFREQGSCRGLYETGVFYLHTRNSDLQECLPYQGRRIFHPFRSSPG